MGSGIGFNSGKGWSRCSYNGNTMWEDRRQELEKKLDRCWKKQEAKNRWILCEQGLDDDSVFLSFDSPKDIEKCWFLDNYQGANMDTRFYVITKPRRITEENAWDEKTIPVVPSNKGFCQQLHMFVTVKVDEEAKYKSYVEENEPNVRYSKKYAKYEFAKTIYTKFGNFSINRKHYWDNTCICDLCNHKAGLHHHCAAVGLHRGEWISGMDDNPMKSWQLHNRKVHAHSA